jgi:DNA-binding phage protein
MALKRDLKEPVKKRVERDPDFAKTLRHEAIDLILDGDSIIAKLLFRDLINATPGFDCLAEEVYKPSKSLHRMLYASGNPTMENLSAILSAIKTALLSGSTQSLLPCETALHPCLDKPPHSFSRRFGHGSSVIFIADFHIVN